MTENTTKSRGRHAAEATDDIVESPAAVEIARLRQQLAEAHEWNSILTELLLRREQQVTDIKAALGDDAAPEHPGVARFRGLLNTLSEEADA